MTRTRLIAGTRVKDLTDPSAICLVAYHSPQGSYVKKLRPRGWQEIEWDDERFEVLSDEELHPIDPRELPHSQRVRLGDERFDLADGRRCIVCHNSNDRGIVLEKWIGGVRQEVPWERDRFVSSLEHCGLAARRAWLRQKLASDPKFVRACRGNNLTIDDVLSDIGPEDHLY